MIENDSLPNHCYLCSKEFNLNEPFVLQKCKCLITLCHTCALKQLIDRPGTYKSFLQCFICDGHTDADSGIFLHLDLVEKCEELLLESAFKFCGTNKPRHNAQSCQRYLSLLDKYESIGMERFINRSELNTSDVAILRLQIARMEWLRIGKPIEMKEDSFLMEEEQQIDDADILPMGPLAYLQFASNFILDKIKMLSNPQIPSPEELDLICTVCEATVTSGKTILTGCTCVNLVCSTCAPMTLIHQKNTFKDGYKCITCRKVCKATFEGYDLVEQSITNLLNEGWNTCCAHGGKNSKRKKPYQRDDYSKLIEDYLLDIPPTDLIDAHTIKSTPIEQLRLEIARLETFRQMKQSHHPDWNPHKLPPGPLTLLQCNPNPFLEVYIQHTKYETEIDLTNLDLKEMMRPMVAKTPEDFRAMQQKATVDLTMNFTGEENDRYRFCTLFRTISTPCKHPLCTVNPYSHQYLQQHMQVIHHTKTTPSPLQTWFPNKTAPQRFQPVKANPMVDKKPSAIDTPSVQRREEARFLPAQLQNVEEKHSLNVEDDLFSLESDHEEDKHEQEIVVQVHELTTEVPTTLNAQSKRQAIVSSSSDDEDDEPFQRKTSNQPEIMIGNLNRTVTPSRLEEIESETDDEEEIGSSRVNRKDDKVPRSRRFGSNSQLESKVLDGVKLTEQYEVVLELPNQLQSIHNCDEGTYGSFPLQYEIEFAANDEELIKQSHRVVTNMMKGTLELFTNKTQLSTIKTALATQIGFVGSIVKFRTSDGRILQSTRSLSYYHLKENSLIKILPVVIEAKQVVRPIVRHNRKKPSRLTHYELAYQYAEQRRQRLQQEQIELEAIRVRNSQQPQSLSEVAIVDEDAFPIIADIPQYHPPLTSYEKALLDTDSESEEERRKKFKQQTPRPMKPKRLAKAIPQASSFSKFKR